MNSSNTKIVIATAGNVLPAALACLRTLGYEVTLVEEGRLCKATSNGKQFLAADPIRLLGLVKLHEERGDDWFPTDAEVKSCLAFEGFGDDEAPGPTTSRGEVYFGLYGDEFEPDEVSRYIGLVATSISRKGERRKDIPLPRNSTWKFSTGKITSDVIDVYDMSSALVAQLVPYTAKIVEAKARFQLRCFLQVVLWIDPDQEKSTPAIGFGHDVIDFLKAVDATIDVDTYRN